MLSKKLLYWTLLSHDALALAKIETCLTSDCIQISARILRTIHENHKSIDPCEDFGQYACGGFPAQWPLEETISTIGTIGATNSHILRTILEGPYSPKNSTLTDPADKKAFNMAVKNYNSCMNGSVEEPELAGLREVVGQIIELFPVNETDTSSNATLAEQDMDAFADAISYLAEIGVPVFGEFWSIPDPQVPDVLIPSFGRNPYNNSDHALPSRIIIPELLNVPKVNIIDIFRSVTPDTFSNDSAPNAAQNVLDFAAAFALAEAPLYSGDASLVEQIYHTTNISDAVDLAPALVLDKVVTRLSPPEYKLDRMLLQFPDIFANVSAIVVETPKSTLQAILIVMAYKSYEPYFASSSNVGTDRWKNICYTYIDESLPWLASKFFLDATYSDESLEYLETMTEELKAALIKRVSTKDWMANTTKSLVQEKLLEIKANVGYPQHTPDTWNATDLLKYYSPINITDSYFGNALSIRQWAVNRAWQALSRPADDTLWPEYGVHSFNAQARYYAHYNAILLPAGLTQKPVYFKGAPSYITYGSVGIVAGHEITHGFDANGRLWNNDRQYRNWWDADSQVAFANLTQCFVNQFNGIQLVDYNGRPVLNETGQPAYVDGEFTVSENIADAGGLTSAWEAWREHEAVSPSPRLPGLDEFTKEQLFFIAAGQMWCSKSSREDLLTQIASDAHAPAFARVMAVAQNSKGFRETWQCKEREPVCEIW